MLKILTKHDQHDPFYDEMLHGRAKVFHDRMNWNVEVVDGRESDKYDQDQDPIYLISVDTSGKVSGSLRVLPTTGSTMLKCEFGSMFQEPVDVESPSVWECTRFCVHTGGDTIPESRNVAVQLLAGLCDLAHGSGITAIMGVYELPMQRVYRRIGWSPRILSVSRPEFGKICCGIWDVSPSILDSLRGRASECGLDSLGTHSILCKEANDFLSPPKLRRAG